MVACRISVSRDGACNAESEVGSRVGTLALPIALGCLFSLLSFLLHRPMAIVPRYTYA